MTIKRITLSLLAVALTAGGYVAVATGDDETPSTQQPAVTVADASSSFAVFQRPAKASDRMPPEARRMLADVVAREAAGDLDGARAVAASAGRAVWAVPGRDKLCLAIPDPVDGFGISCADIAAVKSGRLWVTLVGLAGQRAGDVRIAQFVPDGVDAVTAVSDSGNTRTIAATDNVAFADITSGTIGFSDGFGEHRVRAEGTPAALMSSAK
jgi:hypothetical protein